MHATSRQSYSGDRLLQQRRTHTLAAAAAAASETCPPCFNCNLKDFECSNFGICNGDNGMCSCPSGNGGIYI
jgi:hypothetical protein